VGIESIDEQHKHLVVLINQLDEFVVLGTDQSGIVETVKKLVDYTVYHFQHEEELMQKSRFNPVLMAIHQQEHAEFANKMLAVQADAKLNISVISKALLDFLVDWLCHHILKTDKLMAISLNKGVDAAEIKFDQHEQYDILQSNLYSALRESEDRFKELADHLPALVWVTNAKNVPIFCNNFWFTSFNIPPGPVDWETWLKTLHADDRAVVQKTYQQAAKEQTNFAIQYRLLGPNNKIIWIFETAVARIRQNGAFAGLMGCGMDITTQKLAEVALLEINQALEQRVKERTQALTTANQLLEIEKNQQTILNQRLQETQAYLVQSEKMASIGQLAAGVAHEINNPLGYVYSNLNSLKRYVGHLLEVIELAEKLATQQPADNPQAIAFQELKKSIDLAFIKTDALDLLDESIDGALRAKKIVQDLRDFSGIDQPERALYNLEEGLDASLNMLHAELKNKVKIKKEYAGIEPFICVGAELNQVFMNLIINAVQAIDCDGSILLRTSYHETGQVCVEISDTGVGIDAKTQARMFDPFFTTKPVGTGTGLGLSLSYKIIKDHQGQIQVDSELGRGTTVRILLPTQLEPLV
jgi:hemerythrin-like metal-binding protein